VTLLAIVIINNISRLVWGIGFLAARQGTITAAAAFAIPNANSSFRQSLRLAHYATFETTAATKATTKTKTKQTSQSITSITPSTSSISIKSNINMPRGVKKENLPSKICEVCHKPYTWRKKWESCWDEVKTCSKSCKHKRHEGNQETNRLQRGGKGKDHGSHKDDNHDGDDGDDGDGSFNREQTRGVPLGSTTSSASSIPDVTEELSRLTVGVVAHDKDDANDEDLLRVFAAHAESLDDGDENGDDKDAADSASEDESEELDPRTARKAAKKRAKAQRRAQREGTADASHGQKDCTVCGKSVDLLIRCTIDAKGDWNMVCGKCWKDVSGGVVDGDASHPHYRYGGLWKNRAKRA
jgi:hypothetical protein